MIVDGEVVHELELPAPPEHVFAYFTDAALLVRWIGIAADLEPASGGRFRFEIAPGQFCEGAYTVVEPPRRVAFTWGWTARDFGPPPGSSLVEVALRPSGDGTALRLVHRDLPGDLRAIHDDGWTRFLARLDAVCAGREPDAYPDQTPEQRQAELNHHAEAAHLAEPDHPAEPEEQP